MSRFRTRSNHNDADQHNNRIRKVSTATGIITTVAGNGFSSYTATEGVPATSTEVTTPFNVAFDSSGTMYIAESNRIRTVDGSGMVHAFAGAEDVVEDAFDGHAQLSAWDSST